MLDGEGRVDSILAVIASSFIEHGELWPLRNLSMQLLIAGIRSPHRRSPFFQTGPIYSSSLISSLIHPQCPNAQEKQKGKGNPNQKYCVLFYVDLAQ